VKIIGNLQIFQSPIAACLLSQKSHSLVLSMIHIRPFEELYGKITKIFKSGWYDDLTRYPLALSSHLTIDFLEQVAL
jgi:hypothetical protein